MTRARSAAGATQSFASSASRTTGSCSRPGSPRPTRRCCLRGLPQRAQALPQADGAVLRLLGPVPVAALATALLGLEANRRRGDDLRALLWHRTRALLEHLDKLGVATSNTSGFPRNETGFPHPADHGQHRRAGRPPADRARGAPRPLRLPPPHPEAVAPLPTAFAPLTRLSNTGSIS